VGVPHVFFTPALEILVPAHFNPALEILTLALAH